MNNNLLQFAELVNSTTTPRRTTPRKRSLGSTNAPVLSDSFLRRQKARQEVTDRLRALVFANSKNRAHILQNVMFLVNCGRDVSVLRQSLLLVSNGLQVDLEAVLDFVVHVHNRPEHTS